MSSTFARGETSSQAWPGRVQHTQAPLVSVVLTGRNDGYGGDFVGRFLRTLGFNHQQLNERGVPHEFVFIEWAPPRGAPLLAEVVRGELPELAQNVCSWFVVDPEYQSVLSLNPRLEYMEFAAKNVGIRRARGRFILTSNCDVFLGREILERLAKADLREGVIYRAFRRDLKLGGDFGALSWNVLEDIRNADGPVRRLQPPLMTGGAGDFILADRLTYLRLQGFNEVYRVTRFGLDSNFLVKAHSVGLPIEDIGGPVYHLNHVGSYRLNQRMYKGREDEAPYGDSRWPAHAVVYNNPPTWGLAIAPERHVSPRCWRLEFSWSAVPPMVGLKGIETASSS
jgi:hypothetical protein